MCDLFYSSFVCIYAYANVYFKTPIIKTKHKNNNISKQHSCVLGPLRECRSIRSGASGLPYYCAPLVCISVVIELLAVWRHKKPKINQPKDRPLTTEQWDSLHLTCPPHDSWVQSKGKYYRPVPDITWNLDTGTRKLRPPEPPASAMPMSTAVAPDTYTGQGSVDAATKNQRILTPAHSNG